MNESIKELLKRPIAYQPSVAKAVGSVKLAVLWSQLYYWSDKTKNEDGWVYKTQQEIFDETGLERREQETARRIGMKLGILESKGMGHPCIVHFRINIEKMAELIDTYLMNEANKNGKLFADPIVKRKKKVDVVEKEPGSGALVNEILNLFAPVNPSFDMLFKNSTQRKAVERMLKRHGYEKVVQIVSVLEKTNGMEWAPKIIEPLEREKKLGKLIQFIKEERKKSGSKIVVTFQ